MRTHLTVLTILSALVSAPAAGAAVAPGLVTHPVSGAPTRHSVDQFAVGASVLLPDGDLVTAGSSGRRMVLARLRADGSLDRAFGRAGIATLTVPMARDFVGPFPTRVLPLADDRLLVVSTGPADSNLEFNRAVVSRILPDGRLDQSFGLAGSVVTPIQSRTASIQSDGKIVVTGVTGKVGMPGASGVPLPGTQKWSTLRLNADGSTDRSFGSAGIATIDAADGGLDSVAFSDGRIVLLGTSSGSARLVLVALRRDGTPDPGFNGGQPLGLAGTPGGLLAQPGGSVDVLTTDYGNRTAVVRRVRPDGTLDGGLGTGGATSVPFGDLGRAITPAPGDAWIVAATPSAVSGNFLSRIRVARRLPDGVPDPAWGGAAGTLLAPAFGGGYATVGAVHRVPGVGPLRQSGFSAATVLARPDGGLLLAGSVAVTQYTGEGTGLLHEEIAVAAYRPDLSPDPGWGGPARPASLTLSVPPQRATIVAHPRMRRAIRVLATTSAAGLARIEIRSRGRLIARTNAPVFRAGAGQRLLVFLTREGRRVLAGAHDLPVSVTATFRDLVASEARATAHGRLR